MAGDGNYELWTLELGPYDRLSDLHRELTNHAEIAVTIASQEEGRTVVSISHSVVPVDGRFYVSVLIALEGE